MLEEAKQLGFLGPGPVEAHVGHAEGFAEAIRSGWRGEGDAELRHAVDLGSGGGVPGLALALELPGTTWLLVDAARRRAAFLRRAVVALDLADRVSVAEARAEEVGRRTEHRGRHDLVVARSFGPPGVMAECAAPLLRIGGQAVVSEPPGGDPARWSVDGLRALGMVRGPAVRGDAGAFQVLEQVAVCSERFPRRVGIPSKRPLF